VFDRAREAIMQASIENLADELTRIDTQREAELAAMLTPRQREDFEIRNSPVAAEIRQAIREQGGQVSEEQFRQLFRLRQDLSSQMEAAAGTGQDVSSAFEQFDAQVSQAVAGQVQ
jgi:Spy/CpxP family protein refolding chaperone